MKFLLLSTEVFQGQPTLSLAVVLPDDCWQFEVWFTSQQFLAQQSIDRLTEVDGLPVVHVNMGTVMEEKMLFDVGR